jgi:HTH-type transcriptional regulator/antitoxin HigA
MAAAKRIIETLKSDLKLLLHKTDQSYLKLVEIFPLQPVTSKTQHSLALKVIEKLITLTNEEKSIDPGIETYLKTLSDLVSDFESNEYKASEISGANMLSYLIELQGLKQADLAKELGGQPIVSKILKGERELNLRQIKALAKRFKISPAAFIE